MNPRDAVYLRHILGAVQRIYAYTSDLPKTTFLSNTMVHDAVIRQLEIIGEASKQVSPQTRDRNPDIRWRAMAGMRDRLIHGYFGVDLDAVWETVERDVPKLEADITAIVSQEDRD
jgi:uncharacterized protein with HEPN domain